MLRAFPSNKSVTFLIREPEDHRPAGSIKCDSSTGGGRLMLGKRSFRSACGRDANPRPDFVAARVLEVENPFAVRRDGAARSASGRAGQLDSLTRGRVPGEELNDTAAIRS